MAPVEGTVDMSYFLMPSSPSYMKLAYLPQLLLGQKAMLQQELNGQYQSFIGYSNHTPSSSSSASLKNTCISSSKALISNSLSPSSITPAQIASNYPALTFSNISNVSTTQAVQNPLATPLATPLNASINHSLNASINHSLNASINQSLNITTDLSSYSSRSISSHALGIPLQSTLYNNGSLRNIFRSRRNLKRKAESDPERICSDSCDNVNYKTNDKLPLYCKCCRVTLNAQAQAKQHFEGKSHSKKLRLFVDKDEIESQTESSDSSKSAGSENENLSAEENPEVYCKTCGVSFNSTKQANQHYSGKSHAKRARITKSPNSSSAKDSFKNKYSYKSQSMKCDISSVTKGMMLNPSLQFPGMLTASLGQSMSQWNPAHKGNVNAIDSESITTSCKKNTDNKNHKMFRTPSGYFYCAICDLSLNSNLLFDQHIGSKRHKTEKIIQA